MRNFGVSFLELLILFEQWAGHRLLSEKVTGHMRQPTVLFPFPLCLFQRESKFDRGVNLSVALLGPIPSFLVEWVGSCHVVLVPACLGHGIWGGINALKVLSSPVSQGCVWSFGQSYPEGSAAELLDCTLKLRYSNTIFTGVFPLDSSLGWCSGVVKGVRLPLVISWISR